MVKFTVEELISHPNYRKAWDHFDIHFQNGGVWPKGSPATPWPSDPEDTLAFTAWYAGANSAINHQLSRDKYGVPPRTPPRSYVERQEQLDLFE